MELSNELDINYSTCKRIIKIYKEVNGISESGNCVPLAVGNEEEERKLVRVSSEEESLRGNIQDRREMKGGKSPEGRRKRMKRSEKGSEGKNGSVAGISPIYLPKFDLAQGIPPNTMTIPPKSPDHLPFKPFFDFSQCTQTIQSSLQYLHVPRGINFHQYSTLLYPQQSMLNPTFYHFQS